MTEPLIITVDEAASTNSLMASQAAALPHGAIISATAQTAGRGQRGNSWEAEPGKNLTFSLLAREPRVDASEQFIVSQMVALGVVDTLCEVMPHLAERISIKWPNDIYVDSRKICGILIECQLSGRTLSQAISGIGINVNQEHFLSDAPNPVSMRQLIGVDTPLDPLLRLAAVKLLRRLATPRESFELLRSQYRSRLFGLDAERTFVDAATGARFQGRIIGVAPTGHLAVIDTVTDLPRYFAFKEVAFVI